MAIPPALKVFSQPNQFATTLLMAALDAYVTPEGDPILGDDDTRWAPETLQMELLQDVGKFPPDNFDRLMAAVELLTTNTFFHSVSDFIRLCNLLSFSATDGQFDPADCHEMGWAFTEALILLNSVGPDLWENFSAEILGYIQQTLQEEGFTTLPESFIVATNGQLDFAPNLPFLDDPETYAALQGVSAERTDSVNGLVAEWMELLQNQVAAASFRNPMAKDWLTALLAPS